MLERLVVLVGSLRVEWCLGKSFMPNVSTSIRVPKRKRLVCDVEREAMVDGRKGCTPLPPVSV